MTDTKVFGPTISDHSRHFLEIMRGKRPKTLDDVRREMLRIEWKIEDQVRREMLRRELPDA